MKTPLLTLLAFAAATPAAAIDVAALKADTQTLSSDAFEGREPGTPGEAKTVAYLIERMKALGLSPAGTGGGWTQDVPLATITAAPTADLTVSGGKGPLRFAYGSEVSLWTKRQVATSELKASPIVFVGHGITAPERGWDDFAGVDVRGKTLIFLVNDPDWQAAQVGKAGGPFDGKAMTYYGRYIYKFEEAARRGAAAAIVIHDAAAIGWPWGVVQTSFTGPIIDIDTADKGAGRVAVEGFLARDAAARLLASAGLDLAALEKAAKVKGFKPIDTGLTASALIANAIARSASKNVLGMVRGARRPDEVVLVSAHWDHMGRCTPDATGDDICNGAVDNASGTAGLLAIAGDIAKGPKPARSVVFLAVTAEESGLLGSKYYAESPVWPLAQTVGGVNMDSLNVIGRSDGFTITGAGKSELEDLALALAAKQGRGAVAEARPEFGGYFRSDHFSLARVGVPMLSAGSGGELIGKPAGAFRAAAMDYGARRYHQPSDQYDPGWDWSGAVADLELYRDLTVQLATSDIWPNWRADAEFRAVRDASRGAK
ncbi:peptidase M28 [alpha proteobacterium AAP81b]|nr:peptidase M28 [alpha proteobacterium AAP81b]